MGFKTDGSVHYDGVQNELDTIDFLNTLDRYTEEVKHYGGTTHKADAKSADKCISIKRKKGIKNGSYDYGNYRIYNHIFGDIFTQFLEDVKEHRIMSQQLREVSVDFMRKDFNDLCASALDSITSDELISMLNDIFSKQSGYDIVINDTNTREIFIFDAESHPVINALKNGYVPELITSRGAKSSRKIVFKKGDDVINTGLRIRVTSNNGINAFLGLSRANKNSQIVVKLQQDAVGQLVIDANAKHYTY